MANYILWPTVKLSKLSKRQCCLITAEHPNIDMTLLSTPANDFCVAISKAILYKEIEVLEYDYQNFITTRLGGGHFCLYPSVRLVLAPLLCSSQLKWLPTHLLLISGCYSDVTNCHAEHS